MNLSTVVSSARDLCEPLLLSKPCPRISECSPSRHRRSRLISYARFCTLSTVSEPLPADRDTLLELRYPTWPQAQMWCISVALRRTAIQRTAPSQECFLASPVLECSHGTRRTTSQPDARAIPQQPALALLVLWAACSCHCLSSGCRATTASLSYCWLAKHP